MPSASGRNNKAPGHKRGSFIQPLTALIRNHGQLSPVELAVLLDLQTYDWNGKGSWVGQKTIAHDLGVSERSVRAAVNKLTQVGAIECQRRPGLSNLAKVNRAWVPADPGKTYRGQTSASTPPTPAESAGDSGNVRRPPRQNLPPTPAASAAETDTTNYTHQTDARTDPVPPPAASEEPLSWTTGKANQEQSQEELERPIAEKTVCPHVSPSNDSAGMGRSGMEAVAKCLSNLDYSSARPDPAEEALVVELATRFNEIQTIMGEEEATGIRWQKFLKGFRIMLFSGKHRRSYADASLVLDYLKGNPTRAKEIVNKDKKRGVTNTYHLMFLFDRLHSEAEGGERDAEKTFSKRKVRTSDSAQSARPDVQPHPLTRTQRPPA